jgi:hypothetical protein
MFGTSEPICTLCRRALRRIFATVLLTRACGPSVQDPRASEVPLAIQESAERLLPTSDGVFDRSSGPPLTKEITDGLLVDIHQAVNDIGESMQPKLSGLARKRLMVWVVVDTLRSPVLFGKTQADKTGARIWVQAQRVCAALSIVTDGADAARAAARAADLTAEVLAQELAAIDAGEALGVSKLRTERYIGLHEVEPHVEPAASRLPESAYPNPLAPHHATNPDGVRYPFLIADYSPPEPKEPPAIPPDLLASLGPEGVQILFNEFRDSPLLTDPDSWWADCLPALVRRLTGQLAVAENWASYHSGVRERELAQEAIVRGAREERMGEEREEHVLCERENEQLREENEQLREKLKLSEARVEVLSEVLSRKNS